MLLVFLISIFSWILIIDFGLGSVWLILTPVLVHKLYLRQQWAIRFSKEPLRDEEIFAFYKISFSSWYFLSSLKLNWCWIVNSYLKDRLLKESLNSYNPSSFIPGRYYWPRYSKICSTIYSISFTDLPFLSSSIIDLTMYMIKKYIPFSWYWHA